MDDKIINTMIQAKSIIDQHMDNCVNNDYKKIQQLMEKFIRTYCNHEIVHDLIDIDPDRSKSITYCEKCYITFS